MCPEQCSSLQVSQRLKDLLAEDAQRRSSDISDGRKRSSQDLREAGHKRERDPGGGEGQPTLGSSHYRFSFDVAASEGVSPLKLFWQAWLSDRVSLWPGHSLHQDQC